MVNLAGDFVKGLKGLRLLKHNGISYVKELIKFLLFRFNEEGKARIFGFDIVFKDPELLRLHVREIFINYSYLPAIKKERPVIVDIGSNIGISVLFYKKIYPNSTIYCFEPDPDTFLFLKNNIENNNLKDVHCFNAGLSDFNGESKLFVPSWSSGSSSLYKEKIDIERQLAEFSNEVKGSYSAEKTVKIMKFSDFIIENKIGHVDVLKIDAEGSESKIIADISPMISMVDSIVMEFHYAEGFSHINALSEVISIFEKSGFIISIKPTWVANKPLVAGTYLVRAHNGRNEEIKRLSLQD